jgi:hypothetical protein
MHTHEPKPKNTRASSNHTLPPQHIGQATTAPAWTHALAIQPKLTSPPLGNQQLARQTTSYAATKKQILEELNRAMPVAILSMLDSLDQPTREMLGVDPDLLQALTKLPAGARAIVQRHLGLAATGKQKTTIQARVVLEYIKNTARQQAKLSKSVATNSKFYQQLTDVYLKDYLVNPNPQTGAAAVEKISKPFSGTPSQTDLWERAAAGIFSKQPIPEGFRRIRPALPPEIAAATDVLSLKNRAKLPYIDVDPLLGAPNPNVAGLNADIKGGKNISQLMHWATGVKYSNLDPQTMRELFLAYELWHLEAWDVFGEDPLNDLIAEEAGRILGTQLRAGALTADNLQAKLNEGFAEARAWVGSLLKMRQATFDAWILSEDPQKANVSNVWWGAEPALNVWGDATIFTLLQAGQTIEDVQKAELTQRIIGIYTLIYECVEWEKTHGPIKNSRFIQNLAQGQFNAIIQKISAGETLGLLEQLEAWGMARD